MHPTTSARLACLLLTAMVPAPPAQVPPHHAAVGTLSVPSLAATQRGTTGIHLVPLPTTANPGVQTPIPLTGLPASLRVPAGSFGGVASVLVLAGGQRVLAGDFGTGTASIHELHLVGTTVTTTSRVFPLGRIAPRSGGGAASLERLPDGRILCSSGGTNLFVAGSGPGAVSPLTILDLHGPNPGITPVPIRSPGMQGLLNSADVDRTGRSAYVLTQQGGGNPPWRLYHVDLDAPSPTFGVPTLLYTWSTLQLHKPEMRDDGRLLIAAHDPLAVSTALLEIDTTRRPVAVTSSPMSPNRVALYGPSLDRSSGSSLFTSLGLPGSSYGNDVLLAVPAAPQSVTLLAAEPTTGWCFPYAASIQTAMNRYGTGTPGAARYTFETAPNPDGLPELGNAGFGLRVASTGAAPQSAWMLFGAAPADLQVADLRILVQPLPLSVGMTVIGTTARAALPIANSATLLGVTLHAQAILLDGQGLASSDGLRLSLIR